MDSQKNTPSLDKNHQTNIQYRHIMYRHGPLPESQEFARYETILPGAANRILSMAERQQRTSSRLGYGNWLGKFITMLVTRGFLYFLVIVSYVLVMDGKEVAALLTALAPIISVVVSTFRDYELKK